MNPVCTSCLIDLHYTKSPSSDVSERPTVDKILDSNGIRTKGILIYILYILLIDDVAEITAG